MKFNRLPDWETRLNEYIVAVQARPFVMGEHDCCTFISGAVEAMTGIDPMADFRGKYTSTRGGAMALKAKGAGSLVKTLAGIFGEALPAAAGRRGDIGYYRKSCGVILGRYALFVGEPGVTRVSITDLENSFRVGG